MENESQSCIQCTCNSSSSMRKMKKLIKESLIQFLNDIIEDTSENINTEEYINQWMEKNFKD